MMAFAPIIDLLITLIICLLITLVNGLANAVTTVLTIAAATAQVITPTSFALMTLASLRRGTGHWFACR